MGRASHCTVAERDFIRRLRNEGHTYRQIQNIMSCSSKMVSNAIKWQESPENRGKRRKTSAHDDRNIVRLAKVNPFTTSKKIQQDLNLDVCTSTIRGRLREAKLNGRAPRKVPLLNKRHLKNRIRFAKMHLDWPASKWRNILWTDESKVVLFGSSGLRQYVRRPPRTEFNPKYTVKTIKHGGSKVMVWGCFSYNQIGPIHLIPGIMDAAIYVSILEDVMLPYAEEEMPLKWIFQQDNDPKHTSKRAKSWFHAKKIDVMEWPAQSPDLNPIENLWTDVKKAVHIEKPTNQRQLWEVVQRAWQAIPMERCQALIDSMPRRCKAVLDNKGYATKY